MTLFNRYNVPHKLSSGIKSHFHIYCDALTTEDLKALAWHCRDELLPDFGSVRSVRSGGDRFAYQLMQFCTYGPVLIVEDVVTTGASIERVHNELGDIEAIGICIFARGIPPDWVCSIFTINEKLQLKKETTDE